MTVSRDDALQKINLNLVPVLRALLREASVSGAAASLGRSPSAVSEALSQLRIALGDPLLVRVGGRLKLTPRASQLSAPLEDLHERLQGFFRQDVFDPTTSDRKFTIASSDLFIFLIGPSLVQAIRRHAPNMSLRFIDIGKGITEKMANREIDFALLPEFAVDDLAPAPMRFKAMHVTEAVALLDDSHPLANRSSISREDAARFRHVRFLPDNVLMEGRRGPLDGHTSDMAITVSQFLTIPRLLQGTDLIAIVPRQIADAVITGLPLKIVELAYSTSRRWAGIAWSPVYDSDPAHAWLRTTITSQMAE